MARRPSESETLHTLERAEREDAGRGLEFFWVDVEGGYEYVALHALRSRSLLDGTVLPSSGGGLCLGAGAGVRFIFLTVGARFRLTQLESFDLWTLGGEVGLHLPRGAFEPSFTLAIAYAGVASPDAGAAVALDTEALDISGVAARAGANLDYYVNPLLSFGARGTLEVLQLWRGGAPPPAGSPIVDYYARDGSGTGIGATLSASLGLHF